MSAPVELDLLPLELVRSHLDAVEGIVIRSHARAFAARTKSPGPDRAELHLEGLRLRANLAAAQAHTRAQSPHYSEAYAGTLALMSVEPERCVSRSGETLVAARNRLAVANALGMCMKPGRWAIGDAVAVEAASVRTEAPDGVLMAHLGAVDNRAGLMAAVRHPPTSAWAWRMLENRVCTSRGDARALAILALGRSRARQIGRPDPAFARWLADVLGDELFAIEHRSGGSTLLAAALVGHLAILRRVEQRLRTESPSVDIVYALGVLGLPAAVPLLVRLLGSDAPPIRAEALRALFFITGELFVRTDEPLRDDGRNAMPDSSRAQASVGRWAAAPPERLHLGTPLAEVSVEAEAAPSLDYLRRLSTGRTLLGAPALIPGIVAEYPRRRGTLFDILPPVATEAGIG